MPLPQTKIERVNETLGLPTSFVEPMELLNLRILVRAEMQSANSERDSILRALCEIEHRLGAYEAAMAIAEQACLEFPDDQDWRFRLAATMIRNSPEAAAELFRTLIQEDGPSVYHLANLAEALARGSHPSDAKVALLAAAAHMHDGQWRHAHRVAYAAAVVGDDVLCAECLRRTITWRGYSAPGPAFKTVVEGHHWLSMNARWFPELTQAITRMSQVAETQSAVAPDWLDSMYALTANGDNDAAIDLLYDEVENLLRDDLDSVNRLLPKLFPALLTADGVVAVLIVTLGARSALPNRQRFIADATPVLEQEEEPLEEILRGLV